METVTSPASSSEPKKAPERTLAVIASTMRSGSTLLKALLQEAPDVSQLSEINFQKFSGDSSRHAAMWKLDPRPVLLLKRPAWYHEAKSYPRLPEVDGLRVIGLVRDCYETVQSLRKMSFSKAETLAGPLFDRWLAAGYWANVTGRLADLSERMPEQVRLVRYEDLVQRPVEVTAALFQFVGSERRTGTATYSQPESYRWRWGTDDNSPNIRSLTVQPPKQQPQTNRRLVSIIESDPEVIELRRRLGYTSQ